MKRPYYFANKEIPDNLREIESELKLWRSMIDQHVQDFLSRESDEDAEQNRTSASIWLRGRSGGLTLQDVCELAYLNYSKTRTEIYNIIGGENKLYQ